MSEQDSSFDTHGRLGAYQRLEPLSDSFFGPRLRVGGGPRDAVRAARLIITEAPERFASAAAAIRGVEHASLVSPLELVRPGRGLAVVAADVAGETLRSLLQRTVQRGESIPDSIALRSAIDLLEGLQALERADDRPVHAPHLYGGLTPDSIHVGADGRTRLLDPGIAAAAAREPAFARHPVRAAYTAPEHAEGWLGFDAHSDVFSLGVVLWEVLACRSLFGAASYEAVLERVLHERITRIQRERFLRGEPVSAALATVVDHALQRDPQQRLQSYEQLCDALAGAGRVAEHDEVASFVSGGMRSLRAASESVPVAAPRTAPVLRARADCSPPTRTKLEPPPPLIAPPPRSFRPAHDLAASEGFVVSDLERTEHGRQRSLVPWLVGIAIVMILGLVAFRSTKAVDHEAQLKASAGAGTASEPPATPPAASNGSSSAAAAARRARKHALATIEAPTPSAPASPPASPAEVEATATPPPAPPASPAALPRVEPLRPRRRPPTPVSVPLHEYIPDGI